MRFEIASRKTIHRGTIGLFYACLVRPRFRGTIPRHATLVPSAKTRGILRKNAVSDNVCGLTIEVCPLRADSTSRTGHATTCLVLEDFSNISSLVRFPKAKVFFSKQSLSRNRSCFAQRKIETLNKFELENRNRCSNLYDTNS